jgi:hypothetical protein
MATIDNTDHFTEKNLWNRMLTPWVVKKMVSGYKNAVFTNNEIHHKLMRYSRYEATKQIEARQKYVRDKVPSSQFAEHNAFKQSSKDLAELEREFRAQNKNVWSI